MNMKWLSVALLGLSITCSCSTAPVKDEYKGPRAFAYQGEFYPSFMHSCTFVIKTNDGAGRLKMTVFNDRDSLRPALFADSAALNKDDLRFFFTALDSVQLFKMATKESYGLDGITVYNVVSQDSLHNKFKFWSPRKKGAPQEHKLVEAVIGLFRRKFTSLKQQKYFELLEQYFDFGLPCRVTSTEPFEVRIYGGLSSNEEAALNKFVHDLPTDKPMLIDMTNFNGMGTMFYPLFRSLLKRNPNIVWVASPETNGFAQLHEMGVPSSRIDTTITGGRNQIKRLSAAHN